MEDMEMENNGDENRADGDVIEFENGEPSELSVQQVQQQQQAQRQASQRVQIDYVQQKKSKAQKMITCYPQTIISTSTQLFEGNRFLFLNKYGYLIQRRNADDQNVIEVQFQTVKSKKAHKMILFRNRKMDHFGMDHMGVIYASDHLFGYLPSTDMNSGWQRTWHDIQGVTLGVGWLAIINDEQIKILDMLGHEIKTIAFDRQIVTIKGYQNMLVVVYHESVPIWGAQQLAMQLFIVDRSRYVNLVNNSHVPVKPGGMLKWLDFSQEGMLISQDTFGIIRAFSLQTQSWTTVSVDGIPEMKKLWIIGMKNYQLQFWKTTDSDPQPTVAPRFSNKLAQLSIVTIGTLPEQMQQVYDKLLWKRYVLDHQKARARLWGRLKLAREKSHDYSHVSETIMSQKQLAYKHEQIDQQYFPLIDRLMKSKDNDRAFYIAKSCIRSVEAANKVPVLEDHTSEQQLELDYDKMQTFAFIKLRQQAETKIKPKEDPMKRNSRKKLNQHQFTQSIPSFSQNTSQSQILNQSSLSNNEQSFGQLQNPFAKKSSNSSLDQKKNGVLDMIKRFQKKSKLKPT